MDIRLMGTEDECSVVADILKDFIRVRSVSEFYPNRGDSIEGRVYVKLDPPYSKIA